MPLARFDTPGSLRDAPEGSRFYDEWSRVVNGRIGSGGAGPGGVGEFYNATQKNVNIVGQKALTWMGFPRRMMVADFRDNRQGAFDKADSSTTGDREEQEEYLEWRATRTGGKIDKVTFTSEVPEYWEKLFEVEPATVVRLYQELTDNQNITRRDLEHTQGGYNRRNRWNTNDGIVHLNVVYPLDNTLGAAIGLAVGSAGLMDPHPRDNYELQEKKGQEPTSADPRVAMDGNTLIRKGLSVTLRDPIGIYIAGWEDTGWTKPDGTPVGDYWKIVRGKPGAALRVEYQVPPSEGFLVGDICIGGRPIEFGGQIAEHIVVQVTGVAGTP